MPQTLQQEIDLSIQGMRCNSCVGRVEKALQSVPNVIKAEINLASEQARILGTAHPDELIQAVKRAGYDATLIVQDNSPRPAQPPIQFAQEKQKIGIAIALTLVLTLPMLASIFGLHVMLPAALQWLLATPIQFWLGAHFYRGAWKALKAGVGTMDTLVVLGTTAAYGLSLYLWFTARPNQHVHLYFEASATVVTLVMLGKWLEAQAKHQTTTAIRALQALRPEHACLKRGTEKHLVAIESLKIGDEVIIRPGERIPLDAEVCEGYTHSDESMMTGESRSISKSPGDRVIGGSINGEGLIVAKITATGNETLLSRIIRSVENAQATKAPIQRLVDRVSAVFVPLIILIAITTFFTWGFGKGHWEEAWMNAVTVLVIACPCALGLATPAAIMAGTGVAARYGILIKDAEALEILHDVRIVVFDKTGTLTTGQPVLARYRAVDNNHDALLQLAASIQHGSEHPLAQGVHQAAEAHHLVLSSATHVQALPGLGITAQLNDRSLMIGNRRLLNQHIIHTEPLETEAIHLERQGYTVSWVAEITPQPHLLGILAFSDVPKPESKSAIEALNQMNIRSIIVTGDNAGSAQVIAEALGIKEMHANVLPDEKAQFITKLRTHHLGQRIAMLGDGINDAPALAAADIGIAMGNGTDIAMYTAGITLMRGDPRLLVDAIDISRRTHRKIWQNLFWAFIYNIIGIPLAALGMLNPLLAGAAMAFSSVSVIINALWLKQWKPQSGLGVKPLSQ